MRGQYFKCMLVSIGAYGNISAVEAGFYKVLVSKKVISSVTATPDFSQNGPCDEKQLTWWQVQNNVFARKLDEWGTIGNNWSSLFCKFQKTTCPPILDWNIYYTARSLSSQTSCKTALAQGRYSWWHNPVLWKLAKVLEATKASTKDHPSTAMKLIHVVGQGAGLRTSSRGEEDHC